MRTAERWWSASAAGRASCARLESTPLSGRTARGDERRPQLRVRAPRAIRREGNGNASGGEKRLAMAKGPYCRKAVPQGKMGLSRRHPICSTERAFQLKLATSVIAHLFSEARSQERSFSKGRVVPRTARKSGSQDQIAPTTMAPKGAGLARVESRECDVAADNRSRGREGLRGCTVDSRALEPIAIAEGQEGGEPKPHWSSQARSKEQV